MVGQTVFLEFEFVLRANLERSDYGVPGSPVWDEIADEEVHDIVINGTTYIASDLEKKIGKDAVAWLCELAIEAACPDSWEA